MTGSNTDKEKDKASTEQLSETGWPPGSVGDVSARLGSDVRDLKMMGYSDDELDQVLFGHMTLDELLKSKPRQKR